MNVLGMQALSPEALLMGSLNGTGDGANVSCALYTDMYPDPASTLASKVVFGAVYFGIFVLGVVGNSAVLVVTLRQKQLQTVQNLFILNLSVADLGVCLLSVPLTPVQSIYKQWLFGRALCHLIPWVQGTSIFIQSFSLTAIAVNRYFLILHPHLPPMGRGAALGWVAAIWATSSALTVPYGYYMELRRYAELCGEFCDEAWGSDEGRAAYSLAVFAAQFLLPACLICFAYGAILCRLRQRTKDRLLSLPSPQPTWEGLSEGQGLSRSVSPALPDDADDPGWGSEQRLYNAAQRAALLRKKRRTTLILICMVLIYIGAWLPFQALNMAFEMNGSIFRLGPGRDMSYVALLLGHAFAMTSCLANPFVYAWLNLSFRQNQRSNSFHNTEETMLKSVTPTPKRRGTEEWDLGGAGKGAGKGSRSLRPWPSGRSASARETRSEATSGHTESTALVPGKRRRWWRWSAKASPSATLRHPPSDAPLIAAPHPPRHPPQPPSIHVEHVL